MSVQNLSSRLLSEIMKIKKYKTIILLVILYRYGTWSVTLREEQISKVSENRVQRRIFQPKTEEITGRRRQLPNERLQNSFSSLSIIGMTKLRMR